MKQQIIKLINYLNFFSALALASANIFSFSIALRIIILVFCGSYLVEFFLEKKWIGIHFDKKKVYFLVVLLFFLLAPISSLFDDSPKYVKMLLERRYSLLGFAFIGFFGVNDKFRIRYFLNTIIITSFVSILYLILYRIGLNEFISNPLKSDVFYHTRIEYVSGHMMFNYYLNISLIGIWFIFSNNRKMLSWWKVSFYITSIILFLYILFISEGRSGFTEACFLIIGIIAIKLWKLRNWKIITTLIILIPFVLFGLFRHHQRMSKVDLESEPRLFLWQSAISVIKEKPIFGWGLSNAQEEFDIARTKYQTEIFKGWVIENKFVLLDSHNQYLQSTMEFGLIGLALLIFIYCFPVFIVDDNKKLFALLFTFLSSYHSIFDMFITGIFGTIYFLMVLLILQSEDVKEKLL